MSLANRSLAARRRPLAAAALATLLAWACGGDGPAEPPAARVTALRVRLVGHTLPAGAAADTLTEGSEIGVSVVGVKSDGRDTAVTGVTLATSDGAVLALTDLAAAGALGQFGTAAARAAGRVVVSAQAGEARGELTVTVLRGAVGQVQVRAANDAALAGSPDSVPVRTSRGYAAAVFARLPSGGFGGRLAGRAVAWTTSDSAVAAVSPNGVLDARREGAVVLRAESEGVADSVRVVVRPPLAARIAFVAAPDSVRIRRSETVRVVLYDSAGAPTALRARIVAEAGGAAGGVAGGAVTLAEGPEGSGTTTVTGASLGTSQLVASGDGLTVRRALAVVPLPQGPPGAYPAAVNAVAGTAVLLAGRGLDVDGFGQAAPVTYASADPAVASVTDAGVVTALGPGTTAVRVRTGATQTDVPVTVVAAGGFGIEVRSASPLPPALAAALGDAVQRWQRAVLGDLPDLRLTLPPNACGLAPAPSEELAVDDVLVFASADSIDGPGGVLAQAGPCILRTVGGATAVGRLQVDAADLANLAASGRLAMVLQHELGHVLGVGALWGRPSLNLLARSGADWRYKGARGLRVSDWWGRTAADLTGGVPLGEAGGPGSGHWSEAAFGNELMTPVADAGANPLSLITLEALADLGYVTSAAAAEAYALYGGTAAGGLTASRTPAGAGGAPGVAFDRVLEPRWSVAGPGRLSRLAR